MSGGLPPPPISDKPLQGSGDFAQSWVRWQQNIVDQTSRFMGSYRTGVIDGSNAAAGEIGEYIEATISTPVALGSGALVDLGSIALTAGDWDAVGSAVFSTSAGNLTQVVLWLSTVATTLQDPGSTALNTNAGSTRFISGSRLVAGPRRINVSAPTTLRLGAAVSFPAGTASATGYVAARRMR